MFELLLSLRKEQTIIYCRSPRRVRYLSRTFCNYLKDKVPQINTSDDLALIDWIKKNVKIENVEGQWSLIDCLEYGIGIHDGALQKHLTSSIIRYFNDYPEKLNYLFCTTTIIEGVNTSAKNVVYFDDVKGDDIPIDFFDYSNIKGRSGRMMVHYVGRIFNFNKPPENELIKVDIPFFEQEKISDEILINIDDSDIKHKDTEQYYNIQSIPEVERQIFRENGVSVMGQKAILQQLRKDLFDKYWIIHWTGYPHKQQLRYVLSLGWDWLLKETETIRPMSIDKLVRVTFDYGISQNISELVSSNYSYFKENKNTLPEQTIIDDAVRDAFWILRHWFHYKVPKWLSVVNSLQKYVCAENDVESGDYSFYSKQIENEFVRDNLSILVEYGIPKSAIEKLEDKIPESISEDEVIQHVKDNNLLEKAGLTKYEKEVFSDNLM
ncbi:MAG: hypothetical protein IAX22_04550 [Candidatus Bathyarchaeota archaeon]|nr:hypothetical protein [Candidatus Bathyarchaeota archaeon]